MFKVRAQHYDYFKTQHDDSNTLDTHTHTHAHRDNGDGSFPLSLLHFDPASSNIQYLSPMAGAKVNMILSKTSHFPSHLLTTRGPKHTDSPAALPILSLALSLAEEEGNYMYMLLNYSLPRSGDAATWRNTVIIQGPEACDDPKMSDTIAVSYSPLIFICPVSHCWGPRCPYRISLPLVSPISLCLSLPPDWHHCFEDRWVI